MTSRKSNSQLLARCITRVVGGDVLSRDEAAEALLSILRSETERPDLDWGALSAAIKSRGNNLQESLGLMDALRTFDPSIAPQLSDRPRLHSDRPVVAITGSGKESIRTVNISTAAAIVAAACGLCVIKPCSSSTSGTTGSTELLTHLGVRLPADLDEARGLGEDLGLCFIEFRTAVPTYAARYDGLFFHFHPLSYFVPPLCIPFAPDHLLYGIADRDVGHTASLLREIGYPAAAVVSSELQRCCFVDEVLPFGRVRMARLLNSEVTEEVLLDAAAPPDLGDLAERSTHEENATIIRRVLAGDAPDLLLQTVAMNTGLLLWQAGWSASPADGTDRALAAIRSGKPAAALQAWVAGQQRRSGAVWSLDSTRSAAPLAMAEGSLEQAQLSTLRTLEGIRAQWGYPEIPPDFRLGRHADSSFYTAKFLCHDEATCLNDVHLARAEIVTGFGPTNAPTAGTLSVLLKAIALQRETGFSTTIVVSDLGAWNSRNLPWPAIAVYTSRFIDFIHACGFNARAGVVRTHQDQQNLVVSGLIAKFVREEDFEANREATDLLYDLLNLRGSRFSVWIDALYTIADILNPLFAGRERVLVLSGIEEHYFTRLARLLLSRIHAAYPNQFLPPQAMIAGIYTRLIEGLAPYPKMSKSIAESSVNLGDAPEVIEAKVLRCAPPDERIILQMMEQVSDWPSPRLADARLAWEHRLEELHHWHQLKQEYAAYFISLARMWASVSARHAGV